MPRRWRLKVGAGMLGGLAVLAGVFVYLSEPGAGSVASRLRPGQTRDEVREILKGAFCIDTPRPDGPVLVFFDDDEDELGCITFDNDRVVTVELPIDKGPFWERTRRKLERRWRAFARILRGQAQSLIRGVIATQS